MPLFVPKETASPLTLPPAFVASATAAMTPARRRRACDVTTLAKCTNTDSYKSCAADVDANKGNAFPTAATKAAGICTCLAAEKECTACANCKLDDHGSWGWQRWLDVRTAMPAANTP
jgi:hypothetical protein